MKSVLPAAAFAVLVTPAVAQETDFDFSGFQLSLSESRPDLSSATPGTTLDMDTDRRAIVAAYLFNVGDFVVGPDFTLSRDNYSGIDSNFRDSISGTTDSTALGVRAGYPIGRFMPFVSAQISRGTDHVDSNDRSFDFDTHEWGMGAEVVLRERTSLLVSYDRVTFDYRDINLEIDSDAFSLGLGFRF